MINMYNFFQNKCDIVSSIIEKHITSHADKSLIHEFNEIFNEMNKVEEGLKTFIALKRSSCHRFWFLTDQQVLVVMSKGNDIDSITHLMYLMFSNILEVLVTKDTNRPRIYGLVSHNTERLAVSEVN